MLLMMDIDGAHLNDLPMRYYLIDRAFSEYPDLAAIILFRLKHDGDSLIPSPTDEWVPMGFVITNPFLPDAEKVLKAAITDIEKCMFITGIEADPLSESIK